MVLDPVSRQSGRCPHPAPARHLDPRPQANPDAASSDHESCRLLSPDSGDVGNGQEPAVGDALGDAWCGRAELLLVSCFPAASLRRQASSVADVTGKTSAQRWRDPSRLAKAQVSVSIEYSGGTGEPGLMCI